MATGAVRGRPEAAPQSAVASQDGDGEDAGLSAGAESVALGTRGPWWAIALSLFGIAVALVMAVVAGNHSGGNALAGPPAIIVTGDHFNLVRGRGQTSGRAYVLESLDSSGLGIVSARVRAFAADRYPRVELKVRGADGALVELSFLWRTLEQPSRSFHTPLEWRGGGIVSAELNARDGWGGTITGVALVVRGRLSEPLVLEYCTVPSASAATALVEIAQQWSVPVPFKGTSIHLPFDAERSDYASLLIVVAVAQGLAMAGYYLFARFRQQPRDPRVFWAVFLIGWLTLDARWQANLWRQLTQTAGQFAGKTAEEKHLAADDRALFGLMQQVNGALPAPPVRIHFLADNRLLRTRGAFFLYPQNVYHDPGRERRVPNPDQLRSGDYALLLWYSGLTYDREHQRLLWPDGRDKPADEILSPADGILLVRTR
jgi:hypothetical protein